MIRDKKLGHDLAQKTEAQRKLKRMKRGARTVTPGGGKGPVLALVLLALLMGWLRFGLMDGLLMGGLLGRLYCIATGLAFVALAVGLTMTLFLGLGRPAASQPHRRKSGPDQLYQCKRRSPGTAVHYQRPDLS